MLNLIVLSLSLNNLQAWLIDVGFSSEFYFLKGLQIPWYFFIAPVFYLFVIHYFNIDNKVSVRVKHLVIFFGIELIARILIILYCQYYLKDFDVKLLEDYNTIEEIINVTIAIVFIIKSIKIVFFKEEYHNFIASYDNLLWLKVFLYFGCISIVFWLFAIIVNLQLDIYWANYPLRICTSFLIYWIAYQGVYKYDLLSDRKAIRHALSKNDNALAIKESKNQITPFCDIYQDDFNNIDTYIKSNYRFLDTSFCMDKLTDELNISSSHISKVINSCSGHNFSDYINNFRVHKAKELLSDHDFLDYTIVAIGLESGFNSKSTFYAAFKKFTLQTPTEFRANSK
ncbi:MAG: AraC family transcriptional regulator [Winogradskyella sp.]|uniref:helix-turn-helix domain-containing protein n=1 Tax=Winogradskyella sp. TaxID=1883156 RepID=UPI00185272F9|nr:helix-turn-helix domain-containing protein [Winogradskyella sp.]MBT8246047.1 helix-turn-helix domain-containing protein [Winogradskyella sp.]NNK21717.1 AraC family transcriptional regulator [Winogradskyella sp.]